MVVVMVLVWAHVRNQCSSRFGRRRERAGLAGQVMHERFSFHNISRITRSRKDPKKINRAILFVIVYMSPVLDTCTNN